MDEPIRLYRFHPALRPGIARLHHRDRVSDEVPAGLDDQYSHCEESPFPPRSSRMKDLRSPKLMWLKGVLFIAIGLASAGLILVETPTVRTALLLVLTIWSFCRAYYFAFYVLEKYVDPQFRFAGLWSIMRYILKGRTNPKA